MYVCVYVCIYVYMYICMHVCMCVCMYVCMYVCIYVHGALRGYALRKKHAERCGTMSLGIRDKMAHLSGGTKRATSPKIPLLRLQSSEGKFTTSREIEPARRSCRRRRSCTITKAACLAPSGYLVARSLLRLAPPRPASPHLHCRPCLPTQRERDGRCS